MMGITLLVWFAAAFQTTSTQLEAMIKASPSFIDPANDTAAGGRVAVLIENPPPPPGPKRRAVAH